MSPSAPATLTEDCICRTDAIREPPIFRETVRALRAQTAFANFPKAMAARLEQFGAWLNWHHQLFLPTRKADFAEQASKVRLISFVCRRVEVQGAIAIHGQSHASFHAADSRPGNSPARPGYLWRLDRIACSKANLFPTPHLPSVSLWSS